ncbi:putative cyclin-dependent serine/threonine-protein kinase DDB_G0272797/DDB_G0274007 isoform X2 [Contarinia nasturtii]|uniref:putative cyclin-dependent serine/threonine-protein kinase DDB_G0272797/DDB_G0274007 isoform X2 n=1 Tax=Contarinia nasturtii TaxID=265458 RepID=UPI0012D44525|nr:putative cyclin-dependent serine/threonine-protein kinase DDB_G0272797/DDB_G0274007 isoform X2 [Contarinia nasturtii]
MRSAIARVTIKIIELLGCIACFVTKVITDLESRRVFLRNQKYSREWSLLHNITWSSAGNTFANITYGGFSLITTLMLISRCIDANTRPSLIEKIFLIVGMLCFFAMGGIVLAAFDQVPWELHDNSIILGCLSFFVALVMLYDLSDPMARHVTDTTQTDNEITMPQHQSQTPPPQQQQQPQKQQKIVTVSETVPSNTTIGIQVKEPTPHHVIDEPPDAMKSSKLVKETQVQVQTQTLQSAAPSMSDDIAKNGNYHRGDTIDFVQYQHLPQAEQPVFERVLMPEKKRPTFNKVADTHKTAIVQTVHPDEYVIRGDPTTNHRRDHRTDSTMHYNQMPKYAAIQRQQTSAYPQYLDHQSSYSPPPPTRNHSTSMYKLSRDYDHNDYERPPPKHSNIKITRSEELSRYRDPAPEHYQHQHHHHQQQQQQQQRPQQQPAPMMVIRNYAQPMSMSNNRTINTTVASTSAHNLDDRRHHHSNDNSVYHRNGTRKHVDAPITQMNSRKNGCCTQSTDDEVDFPPLQVK